MYTRIQSHWGRYLDVSHQKFLLSTIYIINPIKARSGEQDRIIIVFTCKGVPSISLQNKNA